MRAQFYGFEFEGPYRAGRYGPESLSLEMQSAYICSSELDGKTYAALPLIRIFQKLHHHLVMCADAI